MAQGKLSRPKELSEFVFWLPSKFGSILTGGDDPYIRKVRRLEKPVIYIERERGKYPYSICLDVVEGFSDGRVIDLTQQTIVKIRQAFRARKTSKRRFNELYIHERVFFCDYRILEDTVTVANLLASIDYYTIPNNLQGDTKT